MKCTVCNEQQRANSKGIIYILWKKYYKKDFNKRTAATTEAKRSRWMKGTDVAKIPSVYITPNRRVIVKPVAVPSTAMLALSQGPQAQASN